MIHGIHPYFIFPQISFSLVFFSCRVSQYRDLGGVRAICRILQTITFSLASFSKKPTPGATRPQRLYMTVFVNLQKQLKTIKSNMYLPAPTPRPAHTHTLTIPPTAIVQIQCWQPARLSLFLSLSPSPSSLVLLAQHRTKAWQNRSTGSRCGWKTKFLVDPPNRAERGMKSRRETRGCRKSKVMAKSVSALA